MTESFNTQSYLNTIDSACGQLRSAFTDIQPHVAVVLGSGLGGFTSHLSQTQACGYKDLSGFHASEVSGHASQVVYGRIGQTKVLVFSGRMHAYEGHDLKTVTLPIRIASRLGARHLILTNAAGGINSDYAPGDLMVLNDQINLTGQGGLVGPNLSDFGPRFPDMSEPFDPAHRRTFLEWARRKGLRAHEGVYIGVMGSAYETKAEIRAFGRLGADAVGMSTVHEVIVARHCGMKVLGVSLISNKAAGLGHDTLNHQEVLDIMKQKGTDVAALLADWIKAQEQELTC